MLGWFDVGLSGSSTSSRRFRAEIAIVGWSVRSINAEVCYLHASDDPLPSCGLGPWGGGGKLKSSTPLAPLAHRVIARQQGRVGTSGTGHRASGASGTIGTLIHWHPQNRTVRRHKGGGEELKPSAPLALLTPLASLTPLAPLPTGAADKRDEWSR